MEHVEPEESVMRAETLKEDVLDLDSGHMDDIQARPIYKDIGPGETVTPDGVAIFTAPSIPGKYELWQLFHNGATFGWEIRAENGVAL